MNIEFYFDPSCPFCWITSRWLLMVADERDIEITWKPFCLAVKNQPESGESSKSPHASIHREAHRVLRVMLAAMQTDPKLKLIDLYSSFGAEFHVHRRDYSDKLITEQLDKFNLPAEIIKSAEDEKLDEELRQSITDATSIVGQDTGVPTIVFTSSEGDKTGFFGPVLQRLPEKQAGLKLWDSLLGLALSQDFYELKRTRPSGMPDTASTAYLFE